MKKKKSLIIIAGGVCILVAAFFLKKDIKTDDIIWTSYVHDKNGNINGGRVCTYRDGKRECIDNIALSNVSMKEKNLLVGMQNLYPDAKGFKGIITYNISSKEVIEILACDRIYDYLDDRKIDFRGNIQVTKDGNLYFFTCGKKMLLYDVEKDNLETLFETSCNQYVLNEGETCLYFSENGILFQYNLAEHTKDKIIDQVNNFTISRDETLIIYEDRKKRELFLMEMETGKKEKLLEVNYVDNLIYISEDNKCLLYTDYKESMIPTNRRVEIYVFELETGKQKKIYRGDYGDNIRSVLWEKL